MRIGLISDTHGLMRPEALLALDGVELILHAGDVGGLSVLRELECLAPVRAVLGNTDDPALGLLPQVMVALDGVRVLVTHGHELGSPTPRELVRRYDANVILFGHTHRPLVEHHGAILVANPGAAGPRRFDLRPSIGILTIGGDAPTVEIVQV